MEENSYCCPGSGKQTSWKPVGGNAADNVPRKVKNTYLVRMYGEYVTRDLFVGRAYH